MTDLCAGAASQALQWDMRVGLDLVEIAQLRRSIRVFGDAFTQRLFTRGELEYSGESAATMAPRLAARFAAKEALIKALQLSEAGVSWRDIEVIKLAGGDCRLELHGRVAQLGQEMGLRGLMLSLSHDGDYAGAVVNARLAN